MPQRNTSTFLVVDFRKYFHCLPRHLHGERRRKKRTRSHSQQAKQWRSVGATLRPMLLTNSSVNPPWSILDCQSHSRTKSYRKSTQGRLEKRGIYQTNKGFLCKRLLSLSFAKLKADVKTLSFVTRLSGMSPFILRRQRWSFCCFHGCTAVGPVTLVIWFTRFSGFRASEFKRMTLVAVKLWWSTKWINVSEHHLRLFGRSRLFNHCS